jgi:predicted metalloprotease with PDZ domain
VDGERITWRPQGKSARLTYRFAVNHERSRGGFDSLLTKEWAIIRGDKLVPPVSVTAARNLHSRATLEFSLPEGWSEATPYASAKGGGYSVVDSERRFDRPEGWILLGRIGSRNEIISGVRTQVAAPVSEDARRQDALAFLNWNLPHLLKVFPDFPKRLLIVSAGDPMWRGGLSGPASLFIHADRPLISENRTSTLLHELVHVAMGVRADSESDWILEGFAEYYSIEVLHRSGGIGRRRYEEALRNLGKWSSRAPSLFARESSSARTARAVVVLKAADEEIRRATEGRASLDEVARELAGQREEVSLERLQSIAEKVAGRPLQILERKRLLTGNTSN